MAGKLIAEQNFAAAVVAGAIAMLLAAVAYGLAVHVCPFSYGFAAAYTVVGCVFGNLFVKIMDAAQATAASPIDVIRGQSLSALGQWLVSGISLVHLVFWFVAVVAAAFLARRSLSRGERLAIGLLRARDQTGRSS